MNGVAARVILLEARQAGEGSERFGTLNEKQGILSLVRIHYHLSCNLFSCEITIHVVQFRIN